jgi:transcriptional regulator with XRE-family HTH domain
MSADYFGGRLRELRIAAGLTQRELAGRIGITIDGIAKLERGDRLPGWATVVALCEALNVSADSFRTKPAGEDRPTTPGRPRNVEGGPRRRK